MPDDELRAQGLWAWLDANPDAIGRRRVKAIAIESQDQAWAEFMTGKLADGGFPLRFSPRGWDVLGLTARGVNYEKYKAKKMGGRNLPYVSPGSGIHMRDLLKVKGPGFSITPGRGEGPGGVSTTLKLPGAAILNRVRKPKGAIYRAEFLQLRARAQHQGKAVLARAVQLFTSKLLDEIEATQARKLA